MPRIKAKTGRAPRKSTRKSAANPINESQNETLASEVESADFIPELDAEDAPLIADDSPLDGESETAQLDSLTLAELADIAIKFSNRGIETLKRLKREELYYIILNQKDDFKAREYGSLNQDSRDLIELLIDVLGDVKQKREGRPLNAVIVKIFRNQNKKLCELFVRAGASGSIVGYIVLFCATGALLIDAFCGFERVADFFKNKNTKPTAQGVENAR